MHLVDVIAAGGLALVTACAYEPGTFHFATGQAGAINSPTETRTTIGCLDLAISARAAPTTVIAYAFGNRCDHAVVVDLSARPFARGHDGMPYVLAAFDPGEAIRPAELDGRSRGHEAIAYPTLIALAEVCVDAAAIASTTPPTWVCVQVPDRGHR